MFDEAQEQMLKYVLKTTEQSVRTRRTPRGQSRTNTNSLDPGASGHTGDELE